ncbi:MAG: hypothetical protein SF187_28180 [Deltaproteobacteria bacterium]|nr:hypothetical protein [Deltaproteobacteria bacterium]
MNDHNERDWLLRLSAEDWLAAATNELSHCKDALERRSHRTGVTHARRAAGMALNALLRVRFKAEWGRSYMDHIVALAQDEREPESVRADAQTLVDTKPMPPELVALGKPDMRSLHAAANITTWAKTRIDSVRAAATSN